MEKKLIIVNVEKDAPVREMKCYGTMTTMHSKWTFNNGLVVFLTYHKVSYNDDALMGHTYVYISPLANYYDKSYFDVRDSLKIVKNAADAWKRCCKDGYKCEINYSL